MLTMDLPSTFIDEVGAILSAADLEAIRQAAILLDQLSYRFVPALDSSAGPDTAAADLHTQGDFRWRYGLRYIAGMEDLVVTGAATSPGAAEIDIYVDGVLEDTVTPTSTWSSTIDISTGYTEGQILGIDIYTNGNTSKTSTHVITDVYGTPVTAASSYPALSTFSGTYNAARLNALVEACENLYDRINAVPLPAGIGHVWTPATHKVETRTLYHGSIQRNYADEFFRVHGAVLINNTEEHFIINLNGVTVYTSPDYAIGTHTIAVAVDLSAYTIGTRVQVAIKAVVTDSSNQNKYATVNSRYMFNALRVEPDVIDGYPVATPPTAFSANTSIASTTLDTRLNAIVTMLNNIDTRLDSVPELWNRARAVRRSFAQDDRQLAKLKMRFPHRIVRRGDKLIVRGKGISLGWGGITIESGEAGLDYDKYEFARKESVIDGEHYDTAIVYLDSLEALYPGTPYYIFGTDVVYAAEHYS